MGRRSYDMRNHPTVICLMTPNAFGEYPSSGEFGATVTLPLAACRAPPFVALTTSLRQGCSSCRAFCCVRTRTSCLPKVTILLEDTISMLANSQTLESHSRHIFSMYPHSTPFSVPGHRNRPIPSQRSQWRERTIPPAPTIYILQTSRFTAINAFGW